MPASEIATRRNWPSQSPRRGRSLVERTIRKQTALIVKSATVRCSASCPSALAQRRSHLSFLPSSYRLIGRILRCLWRLVACCSRLATILIASTDALGIGGDRFFVLANQRPGQRQLKRSIWCSLLSKILSNAVNLETSSDKNLLDQRELAFASLIYL